MIRLIFLWMFIFFLAVYAWKDWYKALCGLILFMAFLEHPDMPKNIMGFQGLNPWNILLLNILLAWAVGRKNEGLTWDMPARINWVLLLYLCIITIGFVRFINSEGLSEHIKTMEDIESESFGNLFGEYFINTVKWVIPGLLLFDGCRSHDRFKYAMAALLGIYILLAFQIIRWMPFAEVLSGEELSHRSLKILKNEVGYHRVNLSAMMAGASWAVLAFLPMVRGLTRRLLVIGIALSMLLALALTGGRAGYGTFLVVGLILCLLRWRKYMILLPGVLLVVIVAFPGVTERLTAGFSSSSKDVNPLVTGAKQFSLNKEKYGEIDLYTITAGRSVAWPYVLDKIGESPWIGYGREAMITTGLYAFLWDNFQEDFPHPHNAYLQLLLDNGILGAIPVLLFYLIVLSWGISLFGDSRDPVFITAGGVAAALVLALMVAAIGSQTFYPREGAVGMWCAICLMLRVRSERVRLDASAGGVSADSIRGKIWVRA
jgi:O-antigen ligase